MQCKTLLNLRNWFVLFSILFLQFVSKTSSFAQTQVDLALRGTVNIKTSTAGQTVRFSTWVKNQNLTGSATNVVIEKKISEEVLSLVSSTATFGSFSYNATTGVGLWTIPTLIAGDSVRLDLDVRIDEPGVHYAISQVTAVDQPDPDSTPNNNMPDEDDITMSCTSAPMDILPGEEILFFADPLYQIQGLVLTWTKNGVPVTANTPGVILNSNNSLTILSPGVYNYTGSLNSCDLFEHCPLVVTAANCQDQITIQGTPSPICVGASTTLRATSSNGSPIQWFLTPTGGTALGTSASGSPFTVNPTTTTVYYADFLNKPAECNLDRISVVVVVTALPSTPSCPPVKDICIGETVNLTTQILNAPSTPGGVFEWRTGILPTSALVTNPTAVGPGTYYLFERSLTGCYGNPSILVVTAKQCQFLIDLSVVKNSTVSTAAINDIVPFSVVVNNLGPDQATNVEIQDVLPTGLTFVSSNNFAASGNILKATVPVIPANTSITLTYQVRVTGPGILRNFAQVTKADQKDVDSTPANGPQVVEDDDDQWTLTVQNGQTSADLSLTKTVNTATPTLNSTVTYLITVRNDGPQTATGVAVRDVLPSGLSFMAAIGAESVTISGNRIDMTIASLAPNTQRTIQLMAVVTQPGTWVNYAEVLRSDQPDPDSTPGNSSTTEDDDDSVSITVGQDCAAGQLLISCVNPFICPGQSTTITAVGNCTGTIVWSNGATGASITVTPTATSTYTAFCRVSPTCQGPTSNSITVVVSNPLPPFIQASKTSTCGPELVTLTATGCSGVVQWSNGALGSSIEVNPTVATTYSAVCKVATCTSGPSNQLTITPGTRPNAPTISANRSTICVGDAVTLTATACTGTVTWSTGATGASITVTPSATTQYTATCQTGVCTSQASTPLTIQVQPRPTITITSTVSSVCAGQSATLTAAGCSGTIAWSTGATTTSITVSPTTTTTYTATCTSNGCTGTASQQIQVTPPPAAPAIQASATTICLGDSATLTATNCLGTVRWSNGATANSIRVAPTTATSYTATCTVNGCVSPNSAGITITPVSLTVQATAAPATICAGQSTTLTASGCTGTLAWSTGATTATISVSPTSTTTYTVTCSSGQNCRAQSTVTVTVAPAVTPPVVTASKNAICAGESVTLTSSACTGTISWSTGATTASITVSPTSTTTYTATCTVNGCTASSTQTINVTPLPSAPIVTCGAERICSGDTLIFTAHNCAGTVRWSTGATGPIMVVNPTETTIYTATCTVNGCTSPASTPATITVLTPKPRIIASKATICAGDSVRLTVADCAGTIRWNSGALTVSIQVNPAVTTTYTATCTIEGCSATASQTVTVSSASQVPTITASKTTSCGGESITLTATNCSGSILWSTGATTSSIQVTPTATTTYSVTCVVNGCRSTGNQTITVSPITAPVISANKLTICGPDSVRFTATGCVGGTIRWSNGQTGSVMTALVSTPTTYTATCTQGTCVSGASNAIAITTGTATPPVITSSGTAVCAGSQVTLTATGCSGSLVWSNGLTTSTISVSPATTTTYTAVCRVSNACVSAPSNAITINVVQKPAPPKLDCVTATICAGDTARVTATGCEGLVRWSTGATGATISVNPTNTLILTATCSIGSCVSDPSGPATISIGVPAPPTISCTNTLICLGGSATLTATGCAGRVVWSTGQVGTSIQVSPTAQTTYSAVCKGSTCESPRSNQITIAVSGTALATPVVRNLVNTCPFTTVDLTTAVTSQPSSPGGRFVFRSSSSFDSPAVANPGSVGAGTYFVFETTGAGCSSAGARVIVAIDQCGTTNPTTPGTPQADIQVSILASKPNPTPGDSVLYTIRVLNNGPSVARQVNVVNLLPAGLQIISGSDGLTRSGDSLTTVIDSIRVSQTREFTYIAKFQASGTVNNDVKVSSNQFTDPIQSNNFATVATTCNCTRVSIGAALAILDTVRVGDCLNVRYQALVKNSGTVNLSNVVLNDTLSRAFASATSFNLVGTPVLGRNSSIILNPAFNGTTDTRLTLPTSTLVPGKTDTVRYTVRVCPGTATSFASQVVATGTGRGDNGLDQTVRDLSNNGFNPDAPGDNRTPLTILPPGSNLAGCLGLALSADTLRQNGGVFLITYRAILRNCGTQTVTGITLCDTLANTFQAPAVATIFGSPVVNSGSGLRVDATFNGVANRCLLLPTSTLAPGVTDTLIWRVRLVPNGATGPFINQVVVNGVTNSTNPVRDISNNGTDPIAPGNLPTIINLRPSPAASIGIAKALLGFEATDSTNKRSKIQFRFVVRNYGSSPITRVQVQDNLAEVFGDSVLIDSVQVSAQAGLTVNPLFTGRGELINLLVDSTSTLPVGTSRTIDLTVFVDRGSFNETDFSNQALASGRVGTTSIDDASQSGTNPDPDSDGNPRNNNEPTKIQLIAPLPTFETLLGIAKEGVADTVRNVDGSFNVRYRIVVKNYGTATMNNIQLVDNLVTTFERASNFSIFVRPVVRSGSTLRVNSAYNGTTVTQLLIADSSSLAAGASDTLQFILRVRNLEEEAKIYRNIVTGTSRIGAVNYNDISTPGLNPDPDGDNNPGNNNLATPVEIPGLDQDLGGTVIVSDAMSPNGDTINDELIITGITVEDNLEVRIYNRWGQLVYETDNYRRDFPDPTRGWNGVANRGIYASQAGVPDGTYFYSIESRTSNKLNGEIRYNFITIAR